MISNNDATNGKSLGYLYKSKKTKPRSPDLIGKITLRVDTVKDISREFQRTRSDTVECQIAAWGNRDKHGQQYLTIQFSPPYVRPAPAPEPNSSLDLSDFINDEPEDCE